MRGVERERKLEGNALVRFPEQAPTEENGLKKTKESTPTQSKWSDAIRPGVETAVPENAHA